MDVVRAQRIPALWAGTSGSVRIAVSGPQKITPVEVLALVLFFLALLAFGLMDGDHFKCHRASATAPIHCDPF
jgi:hypothetical protein